MPVDAPPDAPPTDPPVTDPDATPADPAAADPIVEDPPEDIEPPPDPTAVDVADDGPPPPTDPGRAPWSGLSPEQVAALDVLRAPVRDSEIGYKPTVWCRACTDAAKERRGRRSCEQHAQVTCPKCQQRITEAHFDLTFMGHAAVTRRLLDADPAWDWEPMALTDAGTPLSSDGGMWILLTVAGMTRKGFGDAAGKSGSNAVKEVIGDAIRNAAMRFGCGLELWHKGEWSADEPRADHADAPNGPQRDAAAADAGPPAGNGNGQPTASGGGGNGGPKAGAGGEPFDLDIVVNTLAGLRGKVAWQTLRAAAEQNGLLPAIVDWHGESMPLHAAFDRRAAEIQRSTAASS